MSIECRVISDQDPAFAHCTAIRTEVFVGEQHVPPELEMDEMDAVAAHVIALLDGKPIGTGRLLVQDDGTARIGRMAVLESERGRGVGGAVLATLVDEARQRGIGRAVLAGQLHAISFYERHGFTAYGEEFEEAGIMHRMMARDL